MAKEDATHRQTMMFKELHIVCHSADLKTSGGRRQRAANLASRSAFVFRGLYAVRFSRSTYSVMPISGPTPPTEARSFQ